MLRVPVATAFAMEVAFAILQIFELLLRQGQILGQCPRAVHARNLIDFDVNHFPGKPTEENKAVLPPVMRWL
jgi:hypothetical protein